MANDSFRFPETGPHAVKPWAVRKGYADEHFLSDYRFQFPREDRELAEIFVYTDRMSYDPGETVEFRGSTTADEWSIQIYRDGFRPQMVHESFGLPGDFTKTSETAYQDGCDWCSTVGRSPAINAPVSTESCRPAYARMASASSSTISSSCVQLPKRDADASS
jgi:hypothetical protein